MNPPTTDANSNDDDDDTNLDPHRTDERDKKADGSNDDDLIASIFKHRTANPLPDGSHKHHQWQGEARDEDDDIITDIIE